MGLHLLLLLGFRCLRPLTAARDGASDVAWLCRSALCLLHSASILLFITLAAKADTKFHAAGVFRIIETSVLGPSFIFRSRIVIKVALSIDVAKPHTQRGCAVVHHSACRYSVSIPAPLLSGRGAGIR